MLILLVAACLVWVGILSLAYVVLSGSAISTGWLVAGALMFAIVAWVLVMFREIQDSIKLHDYFATGNRVEGDLVTDEISTESRPRLGLTGPLFLRSAWNVPRSRPQQGPAPQGSLPAD